MFQTSTRNMKLMEFKKILLYVMRSRNNKYIVYELDELQHKCERTSDTLPTVPSPLPGPCASRMLDQQVARRAIKVKVVAPEGLAADVAVGRGEELLLSSRPRF